MVLLYGAVTFFGAPYFPTMSKDIETALDLLELKPGQVVYDLGCGDGRFLRAAARRGLFAVGYELNPVMALIAWAGSRRYGSKVKVRWFDYWRADLGRADGIFVFLIGHYMKKLDKKIGSSGKSGVRLVSHAFQIPGKKPAKKMGAMRLYIY